MKTNIKIIALVIFLSFIFCGKAEQVYEFELAIKSNYLPFEKIEIKVNLKNVSQKDIPFTSIDPSSGYLELQYRKKGEKKWKRYYNRRWGIKKTSDSEGRLKPGQVISRTIALFSTTDASSVENIKCDFTTLGHYEVRLILWLKDFKSNYESSIAEFRVVQPEDNNHKFIEEINDVFDFSAFLACSWGDIKPDLIETYRSLAKKYPDSDYAKLTSTVLVEYDKYQIKMEKFKKQLEKAEDKDHFYTQEEKEKISVRMEKLLCEIMQNAWNSSDWENFVSILRPGADEQIIYKEQKEKYVNAISAYRKNYGEIKGIRISDIEFKKAKVNAAIIVSFSGFGNYEGDIELSPDENGIWWVDFIDIGLDEK